MNRVLLSALLWLGLVGSVFAQSISAVSGGNVAAVIGPSGAPTPGTVTDNAIVRWDGTTGTLVQNSVGLLSDAGSLTGLTSVFFTGGSIRYSAGLTQPVLYGANGFTVAAIIDGGAGPTSFLLSASAALAWDSNANIGGTPDVLLRRDAANTLALRNGPNPQTFRAYQSFTDTSNGSWALLDAGGVSGSGTLTISATGNGTGAAALNAISFATGSTNVSRLNYNFSVASAWTFLAPIQFSPDNTYDIGASGATRPRNVYVAGAGTFGGVLTVTGAIVGSTAGISTGDGGNGFKFASHGFIVSSSDGVFKLLDGATTSFGRLQFGGTTSSFPSLKRSSAILQSRLADDSANAAFEASTLRTDGFTVAGLPAAGVAGRRAYVTNQLTACVGAGAALTGGGAVVCPVFDNGVAWVGD